MKTEDLLKLARVAEGWYCEYKREVVKPVAIAKSVSALANTHGGWIFYGVQEDSRTRCAFRAPGIPVNEVPDAEQRIRQAVSGGLHPSPFYEHAVLQGPLEGLELPADHAVIAVYVPQGVNAPYVHSSGRIYRRIADQSDPREETDRYFLEKLFERSGSHRKTIRKVMSNAPELAQPGVPLLRLLIFTDLWCQEDTPLLSFSRFRGAMSSGAFAFDNFYTSTYGHVARLAYGNKQSKLIFSWLHKHWYEEILIPFSWFELPDKGLPYPLFQEHQIGPQFLACCRKNGLQGMPILDASHLFHTLSSVCRKLEELLELRGTKSDIYFKVHLRGMLRTIPFVDLPQYQKFLEENGFPIGHDDVVYGPPFLDVDSLKELKNLRQSDAGFEDAEDKALSAAIVNSTTIFAEVCRCLGIPFQAIGLEDFSSLDQVTTAFGNLFDAAARSLSISTRQLGLKEGNGKNG